MLQWLLSFEEENPILEGWRGEREGREGGRKEGREGERKGGRKGGRRGF